MELITKSICKEIHNDRLRLHIPQIYLKLAKIEAGDRIMIKANSSGNFLIEKVKHEVCEKFRDYKVIYADGAFSFPANLKDKFRITSEHKVRYLIDKGRIIFSFNKPKNT